MAQVRPLLICDLFAHMWFFYIVFHLFDWSNDNVAQKFESDLWKIFALWLVLVWLWFTMVMIMVKSHNLHIVSSYMWRQRGCQDTPDKNKYIGQLQWNTINQITVPNSNYQDNPPKTKWCSIYACWGWGRKQHNSKLSWYFYRTVLLELCLSGSGPTTIYWRPLFFGVGTYLFFMVKMILTLQKWH